jgi:hypothetical protein
MSLHLGIALPLNSLQLQQRLLALATARTVARNDVSLFSRRFRFQPG